jgi:hypothetical protein
MGIALTEHDTVLLRARSAVAFIEERIAQAQAAGELSWFNSAYRAWRLEAKQQGRGMSYAEARARLRHFSANSHQRKPDQSKTDLPSTAGN